MKRRYEVTVHFDGPPAPTTVRLRLSDLRTARVMTQVHLAVGFGSGYIATDGWRFVHEASPHVAGRPWPWPPRAARELRGRADAAISLYLESDAADGPPFAPSGMTPRPLLRDVRPTRMLYRPRVGFDELAMQRAVARRLAVVVLALALMARCAP